MTQLPTTLQQFRSFYFQNSFTDIDKALEYFSVFGGMGWSVDGTQPLHSLIEKKVLKNYKYIHADITTITQSNQTRHAILTALATGDRREHAAFKKAKVSRRDGENIVNFLIENNLLILENSMEKPLKDEEISDKLRFAQPFMRFWFAAISPYYKGIKAGDFTEMQEKWANTQHGFSNTTTIPLVHALIEKNFENDDPIQKIGGYWDKSVELDILATTKSGKCIAGICKFSKNKAGKNDLQKLQEECEKAGLHVDTFVIYSKHKFSNELKKERSLPLLLLSQKHLTKLLENLSQKDLLEHKNKRY